MKFMKNKISKLMIFSLIVLLGCNYSIVNSLDNKADSSKLNDIQSNISIVKAKLKSGKKKEKEISNKVNSLNSSVLKTEKEIDKIEEKINNTKLEISKIENELKRAKKDLDKQNGNLNKRFRNMYKNGFVGFIDIILGSDDVTSVVSNVDMVQKIYDNDKQVLKEMEERYKTIEAKKSDLNKLKNKLSKQEKDNKAKKIELNNKKEKFEAEKIKVAEENEENFVHMQQLNRDSQIIEAEIRQAEKILEAQRKEEERKALLEKQKQEAEKNKHLDKKTDDGESKPEEKKIEEKEDLKPKAKTGYIWPLAKYKRISSPFGYRIHPISKIKRLHRGVDIPCPKGTPVKATNDGICIVSKYAGSYGNVVIISHGNGICSVYAHNNSLLVSKGQKVSKGQVISKSGSTGRSTGPHLHFEIRRNGNPVNPLGFVKP